MSATASTRARPLRVVIIDDTFDLRELLRLALTRGGLDVVGEAGDGLAGIEAVRLGRPDVVLLDLSMPVMDGLEALPSIRRLAPHAKIIVLSGFGATQMSERAMALGADGYLQKGMALKRILEYVRDIVAGPTGPAADRSRANGTPIVMDEGVEQSGSADAAVWDALVLAPYGVLEVADEPLFRVVHANPAAQRLLENRARFGVALGTIAPELTSMVAYNRLDGEASFPVELNGTAAHATLRRAGTSLLIYLDSATEDLGMLRRAIATTAHEIRGPVSVLCGIAEAIAQDAASLNETQLSRLLSSVARQAQTLDTITADLLTAAEIQRGTLRLDIHDVDLAGAIEAVISDRHPVAVEVDVHDKRRVKADPMRVEQMLGNLVGNAIKYGHAPFRVGVRVNPEQAEMVDIDVIDSGEGVPAEFARQLFREFARAAGTVATGTGLGLYVVRTLAHAQGGEVTYAPGPHGGAVFTLTLPASSVVELVETSGS